MAARVGKRAGARTGAATTGAEGGGSPDSTGGGGGTEGARAKGSRALGCDERSKLAAGLEVRVGDAGSEAARRSGGGERSGAERGTAAAVAERGGAGSCGGDRGGKELRPRGARRQRAGRRSSVQNRGRSCWLPTRRGRAARSTTHAGGGAMAGRVPLALEPAGGRESRLGLMTSGLGMTERCPGLLAGAGGTSEPAPACPEKSPSRTASWLAAVGAACGAAGAASSAFAGAFGLVARRGGAVDGFAHVVCPGNRERGGRAIERDRGRRRPSFARPRRCVQVPAAALRRRTAGWDGAGDPSLFLGRGTSDLGWPSHRRACHCRCVSQRRIDDDRGQARARAAHARWMGDRCRRLGHRPHRPSLASAAWARDGPARKGSSLPAGRSSRSARLPSWHRQPAAQPRRRQSARARPRERASSAASTDAPLAAPAASGSACCNG